VSVCGTGARSIHRQAFLGGEGQSNLPRSLLGFPTSRSRQANPAKPASLDVATPTLRSTYHTPHLSTYRPRARILLVRTSSELDVCCGLFISSSCFQVSVTQSKFVRTSITKPIREKNKNPTHPSFRANSFPKVTNLFCRIPLPTFFYALEAVHLGNLRRF
jgi:hypothetical protein